MVVLGTLHQKNFPVFHPEADTLAVLFQDSSLVVQRLPLLGLLNRLLHFPEAQQHNPDMLALIHTFHTPPLKAHME